MTDENPTSDERLAIVVGFGPVGRLVTQGLEASGFTVTILEANAKAVERIRGAGRRVLHGDARRRDDLLAAGAMHAQTIVLTMPDAHDALEACQVAHALKPELFISARANFVSQGMLCVQAGADHVVVEELVTAQAMRDAVVEKLTN
jgi:CPA2 family monovalent cation:H+ antiporter-2